MRTDCCIITCESCGKSETHIAIFSSIIDMAEALVENTLHKRGWYIHPVLGDICPICYSNEVSRTRSAESSPTASVRSEGTVDSDTANGLPSHSLGG